MMRILLILGFQFIPLLSMSQQIFVYCVNENNKRFGKYSINNELVISESDTITLKDAKSLVALNAIQYDIKTTVHEYIYIKDFTLLIILQDKTITLKSTSDQLTPEMRKYLQGINSGTVLSFTAINLLSYSASSLSPQNLICVVK